MKRALVLVSHSTMITDGLKELIDDMVKHDDEQFTVVSAGGTETHELGSTPTRVLSALEEVQDAEHIFVFCDMGSARMSSETAVSFLDPSVAEKVDVLWKAPLVEGSYVCAVQCLIGESVQATIDAIFEKIE